MEAVERRSAGTPRIPLPGFVELTHQGFDEAFEAFGVNLGVGGISMRATFLPDVGSLVQCRFDCPPAGGQVEAEAEVVWARIRGPHKGEFGLRFTDLDLGHQHAIQRMVDSMMTYVPPPPGGVGGPSSEMDAEGSVHLYLDSVATPIVGRVVQRDADGITIEQELPFLRLGKKVQIDGDGALGHLASVDLTVDGDVPRLLMDVAFERVLIESEPRVDTLVDYPAPDLVDEAPALGRERRFVSEHSAFGEHAAFDENDTQVDTGPAPLHVDEPPSAVSEFEAARLQNAPQVEASGDLSQTDLEAVFGPKWYVSVSRAIVRHTQGLVVLVSLFGARLAPRLAEIRTKLAGLSALLGPRWSTFRQMLSVRAKAVGEQVRPLLGTAIQKARKQMKRAKTTAPRVLSAAIPRKRRRTTVAPTAGSNLGATAKRTAERLSTVPSGTKRTLVIAVALLCLGAAIFMLWPASEQAEVERIELGAVASPGFAADSPAFAETPVAVSTPALAPAPAAVVAPPAAAPVPAAQARPRATGPMPAPTFPALREDVRPESAQAVPEGSPYAVDVRAEAEGNAAPQQSTATFGSASIRNGKSFLIRMSRPVTRIDGVAASDGFTVRMPGSLSLDRAGPIARAHPLVERSMILNRGDHAELKISFIEGRSPEYRVTARGSAIEIEIARR